METDKSAAAAEIRITERQKAEMLHAIGFRNSYARKYLAYRNCFRGPGEHWEELVAAGLAETADRLRTSGTDIWYRLTEKGIRWLEAVTGTEISLL